MYLTILVAATRSNGIGQHGRLPWRLAQDMAYFKQVTTNHAVIMGRKTWESIPTRHRPLVDRLNLVLSNDPHYDLRAPPPAYLHTDLSSAIARISTTDIKRAFVIGGASVYRDILALPPTPHSPFVDRILLTRILSPSFECDTFMPDFQADPEWTRASHADLQAWVGVDVPHGVQEQNGIEYEFQMWVRPGTYTVD